MNVFWLFFDCLLYYFFRIDDLIFISVDFSQFECGVETRKSLLDRLDCLLSMLSEPKMQILIFFLSFAVVVVSQMADGIFDKIYLLFWHLRKLNRC